MSPPTQALDSTQARRLFWLSVLLFGAVTSVLPVACGATFRGDVVEQIAIGHEWVLGSTKHPAFTTWLMRVFWEALGHSRLAPSIAASCCATVSLWSVWTLARQYLSEKKALIASLCLTAYWYVNIGGATMFNNNVTLITFWNLSILCLHFSLKTGRTRYWVLTGLCLGIALQCKYTAIILVLSMMLFLLLNKDARRRWQSAGPWLTTLTAFVICLPHLLFAIRQYQTLYAYITAQHVTSGRVVFAGDLALGWLTQLGIVSPIVLSFLPLIGRHPRLADKPQKNDYSDHFLIAMFALPLLVQLVLQCVVQVPFPNRSYGSHLWSLLGVCIACYLEISPDPRRWRTAARSITVFACALLVSFPIVMITGYYFSAGQDTRFYPGQEIARQTDRIWSSEYPAPCEYVAQPEGDDYTLGCNIAVHSEYQPHLIQPALGNWANDEDINSKGGLVVWTRNEAERANDVWDGLRKRFPLITFKENLDIQFAMKNPDVPQLHLGVGVVAPPPE